MSGGEREGEMDRSGPPVSSRGKKKKNSAFEKNTVGENQYRENPQNRKKQNAV